MKTERSVEQKTKRMRRVAERAEKMRRQRLRMPFGRFAMLMPYMTKETLESLRGVACPETFCKKPVPKDLQMVSFGVLTELQNSPQGGDYAKTCCQLAAVLTGVDASEVAAAPAADVLGTVNMIQREMERIGKLFQSLNGEKTSEEVSAGVDRLNFGAFGIVDWYAKRMGIIDHEDVFATPWARIFQCLKIDHENNEFEKRYRKILEQRAKRR